jgi:hypothetical protein
MVLRENISVSRLTHFEAAEKFSYRPDRMEIAAKKRRSCARNRAKENESHCIGRRMNNNANAISKFVAILQHRSSFLCFTP